MKVNIKTCHITYNISHDFNLEGHGTIGLYLEQNLKITILQWLTFQDTSSAKCVGKQK